MRFAFTVYLETLEVWRFEKYNEVENALLESRNLMPFFRIFLFEYRK